MPTLSFGTPFLIPREILSEPEQKMFDEIKEKSTEEHSQRYKWWSMYDIMKFYGSGLIPKANAANFFPFKIDLIRSAIKPGLDRIAEAIKQVLEKLPPELASDIMDNGVILTGGGSKLKNLHFFLSDYLNVPVYKIEDRPENSCISGIQYIINNSELLDKSYYLK